MNNYRVNKCFLSDDQHQSNSIASPPHSNRF